MKNSILAVKNFKKLHVTAFSSELFLPLYYMKNQKTFNIEVEIKIPKAKYSTPNTIWIPVKYKKFIAKKLLVHKKFSIYVNFLIEKIFQSLEQRELKPYTGVKTKYQEKGLGFYKEHFRNYRDNDWEILKILALSLNVSRCYLVVMLIEMDLAGKFENNLINFKAPTKKSLNLNYQEMLEHFKGIVYRKFSFQTIQTPFNKGSSCFL